MTDHTVESDAPVTLTEDERLALSGVVHQNYYMPDVWAAVERIIAERMAGPMAIMYQSTGGRSLTICCCDRTTARLVVCPVHPAEASVTPSGSTQDACDRLPCWKQRGHEGPCEPGSALDPRRHGDPS